MALGTQVTLTRSTSSSSQIASNSVVGANAMAMALQRYPHMAGTASSLMGVMQFGIGAVFGTVVGQTFNGTIMPMTTRMAMMAETRKVSLRGALRLKFMNPPNCQCLRLPDAGRRFCHSSFNAG